MIVLDTNIISEMMKKAPSLRVVSWLDNQDVTQLFVSTITISEISYGIASLPKGKRKHAIEVAFHKVIQEAFKYRVLSFDEPAASIYGEIMGHRKTLGRPMSILDGQIAAIAISQNATLATRNIRDFSGCDLELINPFDAP